MPSSQPALRIQKMQTLLKASGLHALALNPGPSLYYLTGLTFHLMERPVVFYLFADSPPILILPELEKAKLSSLDFPLQAYPFGEDPAKWPGTFAQAAGDGRLSGEKLAVEPTRLRYLEFKLIENSAPAIQIVPGDQLLAALRMQKDAAELQSLRQAVGVAQTALTRTLPAIRAGMSEKELAAELVSQTLSAGSDPELPFSPIVSFGPNTANPHASPSARILQPGDLVLFDWGAASDGYFADLTRTFAYQKTDPEFETIANLVHQANLSAQEKIKPGVTCSEVDLAARQVIAASGYGEFFFHRTGHGLGLEAHEEPYIRSGNAQQLQPGMVFTIEPGIYLPDRGGVRIEDNVVVTEHGVDCLSNLSRELSIIG
jgi:Xaa-Pro dipeptidase